MLRFIGPLLVLAFTAATSQQPAAKLPSPHTVPARDYEQTAPYWTTEPGWHTDLQLRNSLASDSLTVNAAVRTADGSETALQPVTLLPGEVRSISLMDALMAVHSGLSGQAGAYGSVVMRYHSKSMRNLYASVMVHVTGQPIMYHLDASSAAHNWHSGTEEGIWWLPNSTVRDYLVLSNQADHPIHGTLELYDSGGKLVAQPFQLTTGATQRLSVGGLVAQAGSTSKYGGIRIVMTEDAGFLDAAHILFDLKSGFSATMKMFEHNPSLARAQMDFVDSGKWITRAPMLALSQPDPLLALPGRTVLRPMFLVRNTTGKPLDVQADLHWRNQFQDGRFSLPVLHLAPQETRLVDVAKLQQDGSIPLTARWAQITLTADAEPNDLMAVAASYDSTLRYGAQTPFSDQLANHLEGGEWKVDATHTSILAIGNGSSAPVDATLSILFDQGRKNYQATHSVAANDQWFVDVGQLIRSAVPDDNGVVLPPDLGSGAYSLHQLHSGRLSSLYEGKVITDKTFGHATYGCMVCCGATGDMGFAYLNPNPLVLDLGGTGTPDPEGTNQCDSSTVDLSPYLNSWQIGDTSIISMDENSMATGVGVGSTKITAKLTNVPSGNEEGYRRVCPFAPVIYDPGNADVASLSCTSVTRGASTTCTGGPSGATFSSWKFSDGTNTVGPQNGTTTTTWTGVAVVTGTVTATATFSDGSTMQASGPLTVAPRSNHTSAASPQEVPNGTFYYLPTPPTSTTEADAGLGRSQWSEDIPAAGRGVITTINDSGPNNAYVYFSTLPTITTAYEYEINPDLENNSSVFYGKQTGSYNPSTNPAGTISGINLFIEVNRHEWDSSVQSHYAYWKGGLALYNMGDQIEALTGSPGTTGNQLSASETNLFSSLRSQIDTAASVEPFAANQSETGQFLGNICYSPYTSCH